MDGDVIHITPNGDYGALPLPVSVPQNHPHADLVGPARTNAKPFAEGMGEDEKVGEVLRIADGDVNYIPPESDNGALRLPVSVPQKRGSFTQTSPTDPHAYLVGPSRTNMRPFAEGMGEDEKVGEVLRIMDGDVIYITPNGDYGAFPLPVSVPQKKSHQKPFAEGMGEDEKVGEILQIKDNDVIYVPPNGDGGALPLPVSVPQKRGSFAQKRWADGMVDGEKVEETLRIKDQDVISGLDDIGNGATSLEVNVPQKRRSFVQFYGRPIGQVASQHMWRQQHGDEYLMTTVDPGSGFPNTLADD
jgi:hypothetical protein